MWPWGHLALGYMLYSAFTRVRYGRHPEGVPVVFLAIGTQFPDIVDKPLAYWWAVLPEGRSLAHSVFVLVPVCVIAMYLFHRRGEVTSGIAFSVGYLSHLLGDSYGALLSGHFGQATFLVWPLLPAPDYPAGSFAHHGAELANMLARLTVGDLLAPWNDQFVLGIWLTTFVVFLWISHGLPPFERVWGVVRGQG